MLGLQKFGLKKVFGQKNGVQGSEIFRVQKFWFKKDLGQKTYKKKFYSKEFLTKKLPWQMSPWRLASVKDGPKNLPLKFG